MTTRRTMTPTARRKARSKSAHSTRIKATYNITGEEYDALLELQGGVCALCLGKRPYRLAVDHCHRTLEVRGLLCKGCNNRLLPSVRDQIATLLRAVEYLRNPPARRLFGEPRYAPPPKAKPRG